MGCNLGSDGNCDYTEWWELHVEVNGVNITACDWRDIYTKACYNVDNVVSGAPEIEIFQLRSLMFVGKIAHLGGQMVSSGMKFHWSNISPKLIGSWENSTWGKCAHVTSENGLVIHGECLEVSERSTNIVRQLCRVYPDQCYVILDVSPIASRRLCMINNQVLGPGVVIALTL